MSAHSIDSTNSNVLHYACNNGYFHIIKYLVQELNLDQNLKDIYGNPPVHYIMMSFKNDCEKNVFFSLSFMALYWLCEHGVSGDMSK